MNKKLFALLLVSAFALQLKAGEPFAGSAQAAAAGVGGDNADGPAVCRLDASVVAPDAHAGEMHAVSDDNDDLDLRDSVEVVDDRGRSADQSSSRSVSTSPVEVVKAGDKSDSDDRSATREAPQAAAAKGLAAAEAQQEGPHGGGAASRNVGLVNPTNDGRGAEVLACKTACHVAREIPGKTNVVVGLFNRFVRNGLWTPKMDVKDRDAAVHVAPFTVKDLTQGQMAYLEAAWENLNAERSRLGIWGSRGSKFGRAVFIGFVAKVVRDVMNETEDDEDEDEVVA